jgi:hypothetical protein
MVSIVTIFKQRKLKICYPNWQSDNQRLFEKYPDLNKQQSVLDLYGTRNYNSIWYNKEAGFTLLFTYSKVNELEDEGVNQPTIRTHNW